MRRIVALLALPDNYLLDANFDEVNLYDVDSMWSTIRSVIQSLW